MKPNRSVARANPYSDHTVSRLPTGGAETDLLQEIVTTSAAEPHVELRTNRSGRYRALGTVAAAAAVAAVLAVGASLLPRGDGTTTAPPADQSVSGAASSGSKATKEAKYKYASSVVAVAKANQRLLLNAPGWKIKNVVDFQVESGEMTFANPAAKPRSGRNLIYTVPTAGTMQPTGKYAGDENAQTDLSLVWYPANQYQSYYDDRARENPAKPIEVLGQKGTMFQYAGSTDFATILPVKGPNFLEIRANVGSEQAYRALLGKLYKVDVQTWLDAMPASVVKPEQVKKTVDEMLVGIPLPNGFNKAPLYDRTMTTDRYQVGARVTGAVTCAWIGKWIKAKDSGNAQGAKEAADALKSSRSWKILDEMNAEGDYPEVVWEYADAVAAGKTPVEYKQGLGCD